MRQELLWLGALLLCASTAVARADMGPPPGLHPANMSLAQILKIHAGATGELPPALPKTRIEHWVYTAEGMSGTQDYFESGKDSREDDVLGPFSNSSGSFNGQQWRQNENGITLFLHGIHREAAISRGALAHALKDSSSVHLSGEVSEPVRAYVVEVNPKGGRHLWLFYDKRTYLIVREEMLWEDQRIVTTLDDFRKTEGLTEPWHAHATDGRTYNDEDYRMQSLQLGVPVPATKVAIPASNPSIDRLAAARVDIPVRIIGDEVIVPVVIGGHTLHFQLDSGASGIVIDQDVATSLRLKQFGRATGATAGAYVRSRAIIPQASIGGVQMQNVVVESLPFHFRADETTRVVGLLGFDFIEGAVIHIDYQNQKLEAIAPMSFAAPAGAVGLTVALDDGVPFVPARIAGVNASHFILDTGADRSTLFSGFAQSNSSAISDEGLGDAMVASFPFINHILGVGGEIEVRPMQVKDFRFASYAFPQWLFYVSSNAPAFEGEDADGLIGQDFLRNFDVYLDYAHAHVWFVPNQRYYTRWPHT